MWGCTDTFPEWLTLIPAQGLHTSMALPVLALTFFLALETLLLAQGQVHHDPGTPWVHKEAGKSGLCLSLAKTVLLLCCLRVCCMALPWSAHS